ncbi:hypothetical protein I4F81_008809 [Pyropia yezoensis]|uniref:Uncharacterized protein n=1 Tax=Pyropia yezoensis TaxID=2788 RepID=A0ACC3C8L6_PYRYE|nr:hypothetical protein I4F81_008809 [Neopyropia yezoensis]
MRGILRTWVKTHCAGVANRGACWVARGSKATPPKRVDLTSVGGPFLTATCGAAHLPAALQLSRATLAAAAGTWSAPEVGATWTLTLRGGVGVGVHGQEGANVLSTSAVARPRQCSRRAGRRRPPPPASSTASAASTPARRGYPSPTLSAPRPLAAGRQGRPPPPRHSHHWPAWPRRRARMYIPTPSAGLPAPASGRSAAKAPTWAPTRAPKSSSRRPHAAASRDTAWTSIRPPLARPHRQAPVRIIPAAAPPPHRQGSSGDCWSGSRVAAKPGTATPPHAFPHSLQQFPLQRASPVRLPHPGRGGEWKGATAAPADMPPRPPTNLPTCPPAQRTLPGVVPAAVPHHCHLCGPGEGEGAGPSSTVACAGGRTPPIRDNRHPGLHAVPPPRSPPPHQGVDHPPQPLSLRRKNGGGRGRVGCGLPPPTTR